VPSLAGSRRWKRDEEPSSFAGADRTTDSREPIGGTRGPEPQNELLEGATPKEARDARKDREGSRRRTAFSERASTGRTSWTSLRARPVHLRVPSAGRANRGSPLRRACVDVESETSKGPPPEEAEGTTEALALKRKEEPRLTTQVSRAVGRTRGALAEGMPNHGGGPLRRGGNPGPKQLEVVRRQERCMKTSWTWRKQLVRLDQPPETTRPTIQVETRATHLEGATPKAGERRRKPVCEVA
jgi:hypothetical protein